MSFISSKELDELVLGLLLTILSLRAAADVLYEVMTIMTKKGPLTVAANGAEFEAGEL